MSPLAAFVANHRLRLEQSRRSNQHGYTLLEVLLVVAISALILGPLFAWMLLTIKQQPVQRDGMLISAQAGLLRGQFPRDVTVAGAARVYPVADEIDSEWATWQQACRGSAASGSNARHLAVLIAQGETRTKTLYSVAPMRDGNTVVPQRWSIWRTECAANTGVLIAQSQVIEDIDPAPAATNSSCTPSAPGDEACRQIAVRVTQRDSNGRARPAVDLNATRRTDLASLAATTSGNFLPVARIRVVSQTWNGAGSPATTVELSGDLSSDPDGAPGVPLEYLWELPQGPEGSGAAPRTEVTQNATVVLPEVGVYWVRLTVTDAAGAQNFSYRQFEVENRAPIAVADVSPRTVNPGDTITMVGSGSSDVDHGIVSYNWRVFSALPIAEGLEYVDPLPDTSFRVPLWVVPGELNVELTVIDGAGASASQRVPVTVIDPTVIDPEAPVTTTTTLPGETTTTLPGTTTTTTLPGTTTTAPPTTPGPPTNVRVEGGILYWDPRPGARSYRIELEASNNGCARAQDILVSASTTLRVLPPNPCTGTGTTARARVGANFDGVSGPLFSEWIDIPVVVK